MEQMLTPAERNARATAAARAEYERLRRAWRALPPHHPDAPGLRVGARRAKAQWEALRLIAPPPARFDWRAALDSAGNLRNRTRF